MKIHPKIALIATILLTLQMMMSAVFNLFHLPPALLVNNQLGYPEYLLTILGLAKVAGLIAIYLPGQKRLREWAYAGFAIDTAGAVASFVLAGQAGPLIIPAALSFVTVLISAQARTLVS